MDRNCDLPPPSTLVVEYKSASLVVRAVLSIISIIALLKFTEASSNVLAIFVLGTWLVISLVWLRKAYYDTALIITDTGMKINEKYNIQWTYIDNFFIKTVVVDGQDAQKLIIKSKIKNFKFHMDDLDVDKERLNRWIQFYKQQGKRDLQRN
jgi:hypothetical protein